MLLLKSRFPLSAVEEKSSKYEWMLSSEGAPTNKERSITVAFRAEGTEYTNWASLIMRAEEIFIAM